MNAQETPDAVREAIIAAITKADANFGYSYCLTKMDDTGEEHTLFMDGFEPAVFQDREDGYPVIEQRRNAARTDAILAALDSRAGDAGEAISALRALLVIAGTPITERQEAIFRRAHAIAFATPAPAVDAVPAGEVDALRVDWNRRELADAYDMVEGMRQQIAQPAESPLNQSLLTVMDALEAADVEWSGITKTDRSSEA